MRIKPESFGIDKTAVGTSPYSFLSYAHEDAETVYPYFAALQQAGQNIWFDEGIRPGTEWEKEIIYCLSASESFVFFVTEASLKSQNCMDELFSAKESKKPLVAVLAENVDLSDPAYSWFQFRYARYPQIPAYALSPEETAGEIRKRLAPAESAEAEAARQAQPSGDLQQETDAYYTKTRKAHTKYALLMVMLLAMGASLVYFRSYWALIPMGLLFLYTPLAVLQSTDFIIRKNLLVRYKRPDYDVVVPNTVTCIGPKAFTDKHDVRSVVLPNTVTKISENAFSGCWSLTRVVLPESLEEIGDSAFSFCKSLTDLRLPDSLKTVGGNAFGNCESLITLTLPPHLTALEGFTFSNCKALESITLPDSLQSLRMWAFMGCDALSSIRIPASVTEMQERVFDGCSELKVIYCAHPRQPEGWDPAWLEGCDAQVIWDAPGFRSL